MKESEDHIDFKDFDYNEGSLKDTRDRRHCILGCVAALANEKGSRLVFGMMDKSPHDVVGSIFEMAS